MKRILAAAGLLVVSLSSQAQTQVWKLDTSHSSINFGVDHMVVSETTGKFTSYEADVKADKADFTDATFTVKIKANSIDTADVKRDEHLKNADFFDVEKNPEIVFTGKKFEKTKKGYKVHGTLAMHGVTKEIVLDAKFNGIVKDPWGNTRAGLKAWGTINRYDWDLKWNKALEAGGLAVGKEVRLTINLELTKA